MLPIIDYRNARYQGEVKKNLPHGIGIVIDSNYVFCLAQWSHGSIEGNVFIAYPDHKIFCGTYRNQSLADLSTIFIHDRAQIFTNYSKSSTFQQNIEKQIAILPYLKLIVEIQCPQYQIPKITRHYPLNHQENKLKSENSHENSRVKEENFKKMNKQLLTIMNLGQQIDLKPYNDWRKFLEVKFLQKYSTQLEYYETNEKNNLKLNKEYYIGIKKEGLGAKIEHLLENKKADVEENSNIIRMVGNFSEEGLLRNIGMKTIDTLKGLMREEGIYDESTNQKIDYEYRKRPIQGERIFKDYMRKSLNFNNSFLKLKPLTDIQNIYMNINIRMVEETQKIAQIILETRGGESVKEEVILAVVQDKKAQIQIKNNQIVNNLNTLSAKDDRKSIDKNLKEQFAKDKSLTKKKNQKNKFNPESELKKAKHSIQRSADKKKHAGKQISKYYEYGHDDINNSSSKISKTYDKDQSYERPSYERYERPRVQNSNQENTYQRFSPINLMKVTSQNNNNSLSPYKNAEIKYHYLEEQRSQQYRKIPIRNREIISEFDENNYLTNKSKQKDYQRQKYEPSHSRDKTNKSQTKNTYKYMYFTDNQKKPEQSKRNLINEEVREVKNTTSTSPINKLRNQIQQEKQKYFPNQIKERQKMSFLTKEQTPIKNNHLILEQQINQKQIEPISSFYDSLKSKNKSRYQERHLPKEQDENDFQDSLQNIKIEEKQISKKDLPLIKQSLLSKKYEHQKSPLKKTGKISSRPIKKTLFQRNQFDEY